jgi:hypothetical protein
VTVRNRGGPLQARKILNPPSPPPK